MITVDQFMRTFRSKLGDISYDHAEGPGTRFVQSTGRADRLDWRGYLGDCSGSEIGALVEAGWARYTEGFPESSGDMALWAEANPQYLLWSHHGGGHYSSLDQALAIYGAIWVLNGPHNGPEGHTGTSEAVRLPGGNGWMTLECAAGSLNGIGHGSTARFTGDPITHVLMAPQVDYRLGRLLDPTVKKGLHMDKLIRDSRPPSKSATGYMVFLYNGVDARALDPVEVGITRDMLALDGIENSTHDGQNYLIDRLARQRRLIIN